MGVAALLPHVQPLRLESVDVGLAKLQEIRDCVDSIATDGAKFFDKGMCVVLLYAGIAWEVMRAMRD